MDSTIVRPYLYIEQLAQETPWTESAIRTKIARNDFKEGIHYFKPGGPNSRPIFSWKAVVEYIESGTEGSQSEQKIPLANGSTVDLNEATTKVHRLLSRAA